LLGFNEIIGRENGSLVLTIAERYSRFMFQEYSADTRFGLSEEEKAFAGKRSISVITNFGNIVFSFYSDDTIIYFHFPLFPLSPSR